MLTFIIVIISFVIPVAIFFIVYMLYVWISNLAAFTRFIIGFALFVFLFGLGLAYALSLDSSDKEIISDLVLPAGLWIALGYQLWRLYKRLPSASPVNQMHNFLLRSGFQIEQEEWNEDKTQITFWGKYHDHTFMVESRTDIPQIHIVYIPWAQVKASDPNVQELLDAVNEANGLEPGLSISMRDPDDDGYRNLQTRAIVSLPTFGTVSYLRDLFVRMLRTPETLQRAYNRPRSWMKHQQKGHIGFNARDDDNDESHVQSGETKESAACNTADNNA